MRFYLINHWLIALVMLAVLLVACVIGFWLGSRTQSPPDSLRTLVSGVGAAMLGLLGLLLGFTLSMAIDRWDVRRDVLVGESNAIGTLWLRAGLLQEPLRDELRDSLVEYADARIAVGGSRSDLDALRAARRKSEGLHTKMWSAVERADQPGTSRPAMSSLIAATNEVIDLHELRLSSIENFLPWPIFAVLLGVASFALAFLAWSFGAASPRGIFVMPLQALLIATVLLMIMDINRPQRGAFEVGVAALERVRNGIAEPDS